MVRCDLRRPRCHNVVASDWLRGPFPFHAVLTRRRPLNTPTHETFTHLHALCYCLAGRSSGCTIPCVRWKPSTPPRIWWQQSRLQDCFTTWQCNTDTVRLPNKRDRVHGRTPNPKDRIHAFNSILWSKVSRSLSVSISKYVFNFKDKNKIKDKIIIIILIREE